MKSMFLAFVLVSAASVSLAADPPAWAYAIATPPPAGAAPATPAPPDTSIKHLPGSSARIHPGADQRWLRPSRLVPGDHPKMPDIVAHGKMPDVRACSLCHYPNGKGRPGKRGRRRSPGVVFHPADE